MAVRAQRSLEVIARVSAFITRGAVANFQVDNIPVGSIHQLMGNALRRKSSAHTGRKRDFVDVRDESWFPLQNIDKLVLLTVPVQER